MAWPVGDRRHCFVAALPEALRSQAERLEDLEARLEALLVASGASGAGANEFVQYVAARIPADASLPEALSAVHARDLRLAWGCTRRDAAAVAEFHETMTGPASAAAARVVPADRVDDIVAEVLGRLLVPDDAAPPQVAKFSGRGRLSKWVQTVTMRAAYSRQRKKTEQPTDKIEALAERLSRSGDPELDALKQRYRAQFKSAFRTALDEIPAKRRNVLRLELLDGLTVEAIAKVYGVHVATVARWRASTRVALLEGTRRAFEREHHIGGDEFQSIMRLIGSQLDVSLPRLLDEDDATHSSS